MFNDVFITMGVNTTVRTVHYEPMLQRGAKAVGCVQSRPCFEEGHAAQRCSPLPLYLPNPIGPLQRRTLLVTRTYRICA